jgi:DNA-binding response OmpR family regulator
MTKILIVEDDKDLSEAYRIVLEDAKFTIAQAYDGDEALSLAKTFKPNLVLLDLLMPKKSGKGFLKKYDRNKLHKNVKIVVFTNLQEPDEVDDIYALGVDRYFIKSWTGPKELIKIIKDALKSK